MKIIRILLGGLLLLVIVFLLGPKPSEPVFQRGLHKIEGSPAEVEKIILLKEASLPVKKDNQARIIWANAQKKQKTPYMLFFLYGFGASYKGGSPTHKKFAARYGMNAYLPRLEGHGLEVKERFLDLTPENMYSDARHHLAVSLKLGKKVIIMCSSTGCTLALMLAADFPEQVHALILFSPNIKIANPQSSLLTLPWGLQIARLVWGGKNYKWPNPDLSRENYWYQYYRLEGLVTLQKLLETAMRPELFYRVKAPTFMGYYYRDEENQDTVVSVTAMHEMIKQLSTPKDQIQSKAFPNAGRHLLACELTTPTWREAAEASFEFAEQILKLKPLQ